MVTGNRSGMMLSGPAAARPGAAKRIVQLPAPLNTSNLLGGTRDRQLQPDDRPNRCEPGLAGGVGLGLLAGLPGSDCRIQAGVVGDGQRGQAELCCAGDQLLGVRGTIEEAEIAVRVEFAVVVRHAHLDGR